MHSLRRLLSIISFLLFVASYPELQGPLVIVLFFTILGFMHYLLWGRAMTRQLQAAAEPQAPVDEFASRPDPDML